MTKQQLQQELKEKVKEGVKPSDIRKLKRSKSADDIPKAPPLPTSVPVSRSKSTESFKDPKYPYTTLISQQQAIEKLEKESQAKSDTISLLRKKIESLETKEPTNLTELDQSLLARHKNLKSWFSQYQKTKQLDQELQENIEEASSELITQDQTISNLRTEINQLKQTNQTLTKDLSLSQRLAELRSTSLPNNSPEIDYLKYGLYSLCALAFTVWLLNKN